MQQIAYLEALRDDDSNHISGTEILEPGSYNARKSTYLL